MGGGINKTKNSKGVILSYVEFLKLLGREKNQCPYLVISGGNFENEQLKEVKELHDIVKENSLEDLVLFTGFYEDEQKYSLLKNAFAFIHLSFYEGFGLPPLEAISCDCPAIASNIPVLKEILGKDIACFNPYILIYNFILFKKF